MRLAGIQIACSEEKVRNIEKAIAFAMIAIEKGAHIICFQELFTTHWFPREMNPQHFALAETIKRYNEGCASGDDEFFKSKVFLTPLTKGPFYACSGGLGTDGAFGGVRVNHEMQAYKEDRKSLIEGLYVTGDFASGRHVNVRGVKWQVLNDLSWAFSSGILAGTNVAAYLKSLG